MNSTNKQITTLLCSLAFLFCFADGLSAQQITAKTKGGYSSEVEFLDVVGDSLQFKNEEGKTLTLPLKDFESETLVEIVIQNEKQNGTSLDLKALKKLEKRFGGGLGFGEGLDALQTGDFGFQEEVNTGYAQELKIGPDEDSYEWQRVLGVAGRKLVVYGPSTDPSRWEGSSGGSRMGGASRSGDSDGMPEDIRWSEKISEPPLRQYDDPSLILIATRFIKAAKDKEKAAEMAKQTELEAEKREEDAAAAKKRQMEQAKKRSEEEKNFTPKKRFDHCVVTVQNKVVEIPGSNPVDYQAVKTRTLINDDGTTEDLGSYSLEVGRSDPSPDWLDQLGSSGWELVQVSHEKNRKELLTSTFYFKREK